MGWPQLVQPSQPSLAGYKERFISSCSAARWGLAEAGKASASGPSRGGKERPFLPRQEGGLRDTGEGQTTGRQDHGQHPPRPSMRLPPPEADAYTGLAAAAPARPGEAR